MSWSVGARERVRGAWLESRAASTSRQMVILVSTGAIGMLLQSSAPLVIVISLGIVVSFALATLVRVWEVGLLIPVILSFTVGGLFSGAAYLTIPAVGLLLLNLSRRPRASEGVWERQRMLPLLLVLAAAVLSSITAMISERADLALLGQLAVWGAVVLAVFAIRLHSCSWDELRAYTSAALAGLALVYLWQVVPATTVLMENAWALTYSFHYGWVNSNALGMLFAAACVARFSMLVKRSSRVLNASIALILLLGVGFTFSRSGYLALVIALPLVLIPRSRWVLLAIPFAVFAVQNLPTAIEQRIYYTGSTGSLDASSATRLELWKAAVAIAADHPVMGVGVHSLGAALADYGAGSGFVFAHNTYLTVLASLGLIFPLIAVGLVLEALGRRLAQSLGGERRLVRTMWRGPVVVVLAVASFFGEPLFLPGVAVVSLVLAMSPYRSNGESLQNDVS